MNTKTGEIELIRRCQDGDLAAFSELIGRYQKVVYNCALRMLADPDDAADVTQAAFLKLYEKIDTFDSERKFFSWMYRLAVNEAIDFKRRNVRVTGRGSGSTLADEVLDTTSNNPDRTVEKDGTRVDVQESIMQLPMDARVVLILRHYNELSYREIGDILEIPEKTVRSRLYDARQALKLLVQEPAR